MANATKCTPDRVQTICKLLAAGAPLVHAARASGVSVRAVYDWIEKGAPDDAPEPFASAARQIAEADSKGCLSLLMIVRKAANEGDVEAAKWLLARRFPEHFSGKTAVEVSGPNSGPIESTSTVRVEGVVVLPPTDPLPPEHVEIEARVVEPRQLPERTTPTAREALDAAPEREPARSAPVDPPRPTPQPPEDDEPAPQPTPRAPDDFDRYVQREHAKDRRKGSVWW